MPSAHVTHSAAIGALTTLCLLVGGCSDGAPTDASSAEFCQTWIDLLATQDKMESDGTAVSEQIRVLKRDLDRAEEIGTPEGISETAREGWQVTVDKADELEEDMTQEEYVALYSADDEKKASQFNSYLKGSCVN